MLCHICSDYEKVHFIYRVKVNHKSFLVPGKRPCHLPNKKEEELVRRLRFSDSFAIIARQAAIIYF